MRKFLVLMLTTVATLAFTATALATSTSVGNCTLNAYNAVYNSSGAVQGHGKVSCGSTQTSLELQVCLEKNTGSGWSGGYNCVTGGPSGASDIEAYSSGQLAGCGTWFRTWAWADDKVWTGVLTLNYSKAIVSDANYRC